MRISVQGQGCTERLRDPTSEVTCLVLRQQHHHDTHPSGGHSSAQGEEGTDDIFVGDRAQGAGPTVTRS